MYSILCVFQLVQAGRIVQVHSINYSTVVLFLSLGRGGGDYDVMRAGVCVLQRQL